MATAATQVRKPAFKAAEAVALLIVSGIILYVYRGAFAGFFVQDDFGWLVESRFQSVAEYLHSFLRFNPARTYRPLSQETFFLVGQALFGLRPLGYHVVSAALHLLGTFAVYLLARQFCGPLPSLAGTIFYGVHNAHFRSVYWIAAAPEPMAAALYVFSVFFFIRFDRTGRRHFYLLSIAAAVLGMTCKESILTVPFVVAAYCAIFSRRRILPVIPYLGVPAIYGLLRLLSPAGASPYPLTFGWEAIRNFAVYLSWTAGFSDTLLGLRLPWSFAIKYSLAAGAFVLAAVILLWLGTNRKVALFSIAWFLFALQPVLYFSGHIYPYYLAPALPAVSLVIASAVATLGRTKLKAGCALAAAVVCFGLWSGEASTRREGRWWNDRSFVARDILDRMPEVNRQVPPGHIAYVFGLGEWEYGAMMRDAAFKAWGFPPTRFILMGLNRHHVDDIENLRVNEGLGDYYCFVYSNGVFVNRTADFRKDPNSFYPMDFIPRPEVTVEASATEIEAGKDSLKLQVRNVGARAIDVIYTLNGQPMAPVLGWPLDGEGKSTVFVGEATQRGAYQYIGIRDSSHRETNRWIPINLKILVK